MGQAEIRSQIKLTLQQAAPGSIVHDYERWTNLPDALLALFKPSGEPHLRAWIFKPVQAIERPWSHAARVVWHPFLFRFVYSLVDSEGSEKVALAEIETVRAAFRGNPTLGGACMTTAPTAGSFNGLAGLQLEKQEQTFLGGVMCHYAELRLVAQELV